MAVCYHCHVPVCVRVLHVLCTASMPCLRYSVEVDLRTVQIGLLYLQQWFRVGRVKSNNIYDTSLEL